MVTSGSFLVAASSAALLRAFPLVAEEARLRHRIEIVMTTPPNPAQRFGVAGEPRRRILLHPMKQKAAGRVCRAANASTDTRPTHHCCNRGLPPPASLLLGVRLPAHAS